MPKPTFGFTRAGAAVYAHRFDHLPAESRYQRFNRWLAIRSTKMVGTMTCAYVFGLIALISLPAAIATHSVIIIVAWVAQTFLQLTLLSIIIVGQNISGEAADARAAKTFEDVEAILDRLDAHTQGGIKEILDALSRPLGTVTRADRDLLDPVLGSEYMLSLMEHNKQLWQVTGELITRAFVAGKAAAR